MSGSGSPHARAHLSIGEVLSLLQDEFPDVTISKIRFLESQGLLDPERTPSGYRKFYDYDIERLRWILRLQKDHYLPLKVIKDRLDEAGGMLPFEDGSELAQIEREPSLLTTEVTSGPRELPGTAASGSGGRADGASSQGQSGSGSASRSGSGSGGAAQARSASDGAAARNGRVAVTERDRSGRPSGPGAAAAGSGGASGSGGSTGGSSSGSGAPSAPAASGAGSSAPSRPGSSSPGGAGTPRSGGAPGPGRSGGPSSPGSSSRPPSADRRPAPAGRNDGASGGAGSSGRSAGSAANGRAAPSSSSPPGGRGPSGQGPSQPSRSRPPSTPPGRTGAARQGSAAGSRPAPRRNPPGPAPARSRVPEPSPGVNGHGAGFDPGADAVSLSLDELAEASGLTPRDVRDLERYGLIESRQGDGGRYDGDALVIARTAAGFLQHGIEARHMRTYKVAVDREAGLFEQVVSPLLKQRNPEARVRAQRTVTELIRLGEVMRGVLLRRELRDHTGGG